MSNMLLLASFTNSKTIIRKDLGLMSSIRRWFKDERTRRKIAALDADGFAAMGYPRTGREELLILSKLIAWVSEEIQSASIVID